MLSLGLLKVGREEGGVLEFFCRGKTQQNQNREYSVFFCFGARSNRFIPSKRNVVVLNLNFWFDLPCYFLSSAFTRWIQV